MLVLTKTKLRWKGELAWSGVNVLFAGVQEMERVRAVLLNDVWHSAVVKYGCVSSRIPWIKFKFSRVLSFQGLKFVWWWVTTPMKKMVKKEILERHGQDFG